MTDAMDYDAWAEWYDVVYSTAGTDEVEFYVDLATRLGGPVLEIGCGTGRIAIPTALAGVRTVGVDASPAMLAKAREKLERAGVPEGMLELVQGDMRDLRLSPEGRSFPLVTLPARTLLLATTQEEQIAVLRECARHLSPEGRLVFNAFVPDPQMLADTNNSAFLEAKTTHPETGNRCLFWAHNRFNPVSQTNHGLQIVEELGCGGETLRRVYLDVLLRYIHPAEAGLMIEAAGLEAEEVYGGFDGAPLDEASEEMVWVARRAP